MTLNFRAVLPITGNSNSDHTANTLTILRDRDDTVDIGSGWSPGSGAVSRVTEQIYTRGAATLQVGPGNRPPVFTSSATPNVAEITTAVLTLPARHTPLGGCAPGEHAN